MPGGGNGINKMDHNPNQREVLLVGSVWGQGDSILLVWDGIMLLLKLQVSRLGSPFKPIGTESIICG